MYTNTNLEHKLIEHEGMKKSAYEDSLGFLTIGIGRLIDARKGAGLSVDEIFYLMRNDIDRLHRELTNYSWFKCLNDVRQGVIIELAFNVGINGLLSFKRMIAALEPLNPPLAAKEMLDSKWAEQVGANRANDMASRLREGRYL